MKVRMKVTLSGTLDGVAYPRAGVSWEVPDPVGANLCSKGFAEPVVEDRTEKAVVTEEPEVRRGRPRNPA